jgi:hypothetical protein
VMNCFLCECLYRFNIFFITFQYIFEWLYIIMSRSNNKNDKKIAILQRFLNFLRAKKFRHSRIPIKVPQYYQNLHILIALYIQKKNCDIRALFHNQPMGRFVSRDAASKPPSLKNRARIEGDRHVSRDFFLNNTNFLFNSRNSARFQKSAKV